LRLSSLFYAPSLRDTLFRIQELVSVTIDRVVPLVEAENKQLVWDRQQALAYDRPSRQQPSRLDIYDYNYDFG
jgi:hypothetical protein